MKSRFWSIHFKYGFFSFVCSLLACCSGSFGSHKNKEKQSKTVMNALRFDLSNNESYGLSAITKYLTCRSTNKERCSTAGQRSFVHSNIPGSCSSLPGLSKSCLLYTSGRRPPAQHPAAAVRWRKFRRGHRTQSGCD